MEPYIRVRRDDVSMRHKWMNHRGEHLLAACPASVVAHMNRVRPVACLATQIPTYVEDPGETDWRRCDGALGAFSHDLFRVTYIGGVAAKMDCSLRIVS